MYFWKYIFIILLLVLSLGIIALFQLPDSNLHIIACDVGQGDAILAVYKSFQILTDGGPPNGKVIDCLSRHLPFWDRKIEVVVNTHPQLDHFGGLIDVFKKYKVANFVTNGLDSSAPEYQVLKKEVGGSGVRVLNPTTGMAVGWGMISYDIFWPWQRFLEQKGAGQATNQLGSFTSNLDSNEFSVQAILRLGEFKALLTGDIGKDDADEVLLNLPVDNIDYIKIPHHGSKNGATINYLSHLEPKIAVISVGKNNPYGHPAPEILKILNDRGIKILRTDEGGDVEIITDGRGYRVSE